MQVSKEGIEAIKAANDIASVVAERGIEIAKKGKVYVARCPFHDEKTASFTITPAKGLFHCFGCKKAGDVIGFVTHHDKIGFPEAVKRLAARAGLDVDKLMESRPRQVVIKGPMVDAASDAVIEAPTTAPAAILTQVVEHYHRTFCERADAQEYMRKRGLVDADVLKAFKVGYADGSLLKRVGKGEARDALLSLGVITDEGRELMGGCIVVPIPDPITGQWTTLYGRGMRTPRHCYLPGPLRGVLNYQAARASAEVILAESVLDALSFHQAGIFTAIPIYGTNGFMPDHMDLLTRERVRRVILALDGDAAGRKATAALKDKLTAAGIDVRVMPYPPNVKDPNELLVSSGTVAAEAFRKCLDEAEPRPAPIEAAAPAPAGSEPAASDGRATLSRNDRAYSAHVLSSAAGRLRATVRANRDALFHVDTIDLYASRARSEFAKRAAKTLNVDAATIEADLLALLLEAEKAAQRASEPATGVASTAALTESERALALSLLKSPDLLDHVARDVDALGYVGEDTNKRLLYLVAVSRKLADPLSAIVLSQSGAGKSGITEVIERLTPPEDVVLITRLTPQSLYYVEPGFLDQKLVIIEERYGSMEADYSIRVLQSRKKLIAAAPVKDPQTGNMRTKTFTVEARAAFIEATTAGNVNHENATRCFELSMDESAEQTKRIHERQRLSKTEAGLRMREEAEAIKRRHWNAQRLLEPLPVIIPYADKLTFPWAWMRTRRDHARFLNLIEVSAFLHQHQRERRFGAVVASAADYAVAYGLAASILADTLSDLRRALRDAYTAIQALAAERGGVVSRREIREALALPDGTVRHWLAELVELDYLRVESGGQGKAARYTLTDKGPQKDLVLGLLSPDELRRLIP